MNAPITPAATQQRRDLEEEIYQLYGLVNMLCSVAFEAEPKAYVFNLRTDVVHGVMRAMQDSAERVYCAYHGKEANA
jgi:hypothetical protein